MSASENDDSKIKIMIFGIDRLGYKLPNETSELSAASLHFRHFATEEKFQAYDGVILFQGTFEEANEDQVYNFEEGELLKRENQLRQLLEQRGFCCILLCKKFIDTSHPYSQNVSHTDLAKRALNLPGFYRSPLAKPTTKLAIVRDEFRRFLKEYGSAHTNFENRKKDMEVKPICLTPNGYLCGLILDDSLFFIPCLLPDKRMKQFGEFFKFLANALVSSRAKLVQEIPAWANEFRFRAEQSLFEEKNELTARITKVKDALKTFTEYKKCLCFDGERLKQSVIHLLEHGLKLKVDPEDNLKEDLKIVDPEQKPLVLVEVKGTNKGVQREFINQADSHRERSEKPPDFPSIVIVNTNIKNARHLKDKYQEVAKEHAAHAVKMKVLVLRTIDLLNLLYLVEAGSITPDQILSLIRSQYGWLKVSQEAYEILKGEK
jgi:hypothetical protein